jgi:formate dehydrogenase major subunit
VVNDLFGIAADPNVFIQECKVATCDIRPGPRPRGQELTAMLAGVRDHAEITTDTGTHIDTAAGSPHPAHTEESR